MPAPKLTTELEKKHFKQRNAFKFMKNSVASSWSMRELKSWEDFYKKIGLPINKGVIIGRAFDWEGCKYVLGLLEQDLEKRIANELGTIQSTPTITPSSPKAKEESPKPLTYAEQKQKESEKVSKNVSDSEEETQEDGTHTVGGRTYRIEKEFPLELFPISYGTTRNNIHSGQDSALETNDNLKQIAHKTTEAGVAQLRESTEEAQECIIEQPLATTPSGITVYKSDSAAKLEEPTVKLTEENNYLFTPSPNEDPKTWFSWFQKKAITEILQKLVVEKKTGILLIAATGTGKTYIMKGVARRLIDMNYHESRCFSHIPYLVVTRATVVEQTERALKVDNIHPDEEVTVCNIEQLRSSKGAYWIKREMKVVDVTEDGTPVEQEIYKWKKMLNPCVLFFDESQSAKNKQSSQSQIIYAYNDIEKNAQLISISATPFTKVSEAQAFAVSTHRPLEHLGFPDGSILTNETWPAYAKAIAAPAAPEENNEAAIERLMRDLEPWVVRVKGVRPQFDANNKIERIGFETREEEAFYQAAWDRFLEEKKKKEEEVDGDRFMFVILLKFAMAAEECRVNILARRMFESVQKGNAAVCACKFKTTIIKIVVLLTDKDGPYKVSRNIISLVWGGGQTQLTAKQKAKAKIKALAKKMAQANANLGEDEESFSEAEMLETMGLEEVEDRELMNLPPELRLDSQDKVQRQSEIDKFQSGKSLYCLFTFRAGGVGLSLHHTDELTKEKCRRKKSGYVYEEDIKNIPVRPRETFLAPTYSAIELVQGLGRAPRLTSLSNTQQTLLFYRGTVEDDIADIVSSKLRCLGKVVKQKESWQDVIVGGHKQKYMSNGDEAPSEEDSASNLGDVEG